MSINGTKVTKKNNFYEVYDWNEDNIVFCDPVVKTVPGTEPKISFYSIPVLTKNVDENGNPDGTMGDLVLGFDKMFSFGVQENLDPTTKAVTGHSVALTMYNRDGATEKEIRAVSVIENVIKKAKDFLLENKKVIKKPKLEISDLKNMDNLLYWKLDEEGNKVQGQGPTFSPKLIEFKERKDDKGNVKPYQMNSIFYEVDENGDFTEVDENGDPIIVNPLKYLSTKNSKNYCYIRAAIKIEDIYFGSKICVRCKVTEADVTAVNMGPKRLLHSQRKVFVDTKIGFNTSSSVNPLIASNFEKGEDDDESEDDKKKKVEEPSSPVKKKKVSKPVKKSNVELE